MEPQNPNPKLNILCFVAPLALMVFTFLTDGASWFGPFDSLIFALIIAGVLLICALTAVGLLLFRPSCKTKQAAWSYLFGFAVATSLVVLAAFATLSGQSSPWLQ